MTKVFCPVCGTTEELDTEDPEYPGYIGCYQCDYWLPEEAWNVLCKGKLTAEAFKVIQDNYYKPVITINFINGEWEALAGSWGAEGAPTLEDLFIKLAESIKQRPMWTASIP